MTLAGHEVSPPPQLANPQLFAPVQLSRHSEPPPQVIWSQLLAPLQAISHCDPPEQDASQLFTPAQSMLHGLPLHEASQVPLVA
jgi:hypothetical protein